MGDGVAGKVTRDRRKARDRPGTRFDSGIRELLSQLERDGLHADGDDDHYQPNRPGRRHTRGRRLRRLPSFLRRKDPAKRRGSLRPCQHAGNQPERQYESVLLLPRHPQDLEHGQLSFGERANLVPAPEVHGIVLGRGHDRAHSGCSGALHQPDVQNRAQCGQPASPSHAEHGIDCGIEYQTRWLLHQAGAVLLRPRRLHCAQQPAACEPAAESAHGRHGNGDAGGQGAFRAERGCAHLRW